MTLRLATGALAATCSVFLLGACGSGGQSANTGQSASKPAASSSSTAAGATPSSGAAKPAAAVKITIKNFKYQVPASVKPGAKITITDSDDASHTVTSDKGGLFNVVIPGSGTAAITAPTAPGKYPFHCKFHGNMHGVLVVS